MTRSARDPLYRRHRFPAEVIAHAVWLYFRFPLNLRMVEDMLAARGVIVSHQTVRLWAEKFGRQFANDIRRRSAGRLGDKWYFDEVVITIGGEETLALARRGSGWLRPRCSGPKSPRCQGCKAVDAQASERARICPARHDHRQASILWCGEAGDPTRRRAPFSQGLEQSGGEFSSTYPAA